MNMPMEQLEALIKEYDRIKAHLPQASKLLNDTSAALLELWNLKCQRRADEAERTAKNS